MLRFSIERVALKLASQLNNVCETVSGHSWTMLGSCSESSLHCGSSFHLFLEVQSSWQAQHFVNLHVQISWQAFVNLRADFVAGAALCEPPCAEFVAGTALCELPCAEFVAGAALCEPPCADFMAGTALCEPPCADFVAGAASVELEAENWRLCSATLVHGVSTELEDENWRLCSTTLWSWKTRTGDFVQL